MVIKIKNLTKLVISLTIPHLFMYLQNLSCTGTTFRNISKLFISWIKLIQILLIVWPSLYSWFWLNLFWEIYTGKTKFYHNLSSNHIKLVYYTGNIVLCCTWHLNNSISRFKLIKKRLLNHSLKIVIKLIQSLEHKRAVLSSTQPWLALPIKFNNFNGKSKQLNMIF